MNMPRGILPFALGLAIFAAPAFTQSRSRAAAPQRGNSSPYVPNRYILFLQDEPVVARFKAQDQLQPAAAAYRRQVESRQQAVIGELASRGIEVAGSVSTVMNAVFVVAPPSRLAELSAIPGVVGVRGGTAGPVQLKQGGRAVEGARSVDGHRRPVDRGQGNQDRHPRYRYRRREASSASGIRRYGVRFARGLPEMQPAERLR